MKPIAIALLILALPLATGGAKTPANNQPIDRLPQPHYHPEPSDPAWLASVVQFHGHLGPSVVAGTRMGTLQWVQADRLTVRIRTPERARSPCFDRLPR